MASRNLKIARFIFGTIIVLGLSPILLALGAETLANSAGCVLDESAAHECIILGKDRSSALYALFVFGWMAMLSVPFSFLTAIVWGITELVLRSKNTRRG